MGEEAGTGLLPRAEEIKVRAQRRWHLRRVSGVMGFLDAIKRLCSLTPDHGHLWATPFWAQILTTSLRAETSGCSDQSCR